MFETFKSEEDFMDNWDRFLQAYQTCQISAQHFYKFQDIWPATYLAAASKIEKATKLRSKHTSNDKDMKVFYITGKSGSGKTLLAKYFQEVIYQQDYSQSGTGEHRFDRYDYEPGFNFNDFRSSDMPLNDFLNLTDNHTNVDIAARYHNKSFCNCRLMILTSVDAYLDQYYQTFHRKAEDGLLVNENKQVEEAWQFYRRVDNGHFYQIEDDGRITYHEVHKVIGSTDNTYDEDCIGNLDFDMTAVYDHYNIKYHREAYNKLVVDDEKDTTRDPMARHLVLKKDKFKDIDPNSFF